MAENTLQLSRTNLIINYIPQSVTDTDLFNMFRMFGIIIGCKVIKDHKTGDSRGYGFVNYSRPVDAAKAITFLNGKVIGKKRMKVSYARPRSEDFKNTNLYITNLPRNITDEQLVCWFRPYGNIVQQTLLKDPATSIPRGVAFVRYAKHEEAQKAVALLNGTTPDGGVQKIRVQIAKERLAKRPVGSRKTVTLAFPIHELLATRIWANSQREPWE